MLIVSCRALSIITDDYDSENSSFEHPQPPKSAKDAQSSLTPGISQALNRLDLAGKYHGDTSLLLCLSSQSTWNKVSQDYLNFVYPLIPVVHIPTFLAAVDENRAASNVSFSCLQLSIFSIVIAMVPQRFEHYKNLDETLYYNYNITNKWQAVNQSHDIFDLIKASTFYDNPTMETWATTYLFGAAYACLNNPARSNLYRSHAYTIMLSMNFHLVNSYIGLNFIETQLRKKAMWMTLTGLMFVHVSPLIYLTC